MANDPEKLLDVDPAEFIQSLAHALRHDGRKRAVDANEYMGRVAAERLYDALTWSGFVIKRRSQGPGHSDTKHRKAGTD